MIHNDNDTDILSQNLFQVLIYADGLYKKLLLMFRFFITMGKYHIHKRSGITVNPL